MFDYNSALFDIVSRLELCGIKLTDAELLEKTFSTFHASNIVLQQQYRQRQFAIYSDLISGGTPLALEVANASLDVSDFFEDL